MLLNYNSGQPLYVIGQGISVQEIAHWIKETESIDVFPVTTEDFVNLSDNSQGIIGFWNFSYRKEFIEKIKTLKRRWPTYIHPQTYVTNQNLIGQGTVVLSMSVLGYGVSVGDFCMIGEFCKIGHNTQLGNNVVMTPGSIIGGSTKIHDNVWLGQSSSVKDQLNITNNVEFLMNSVVTKDILESGKYYGNKKVFC